MRTYTTVIIIIITNMSVPISGVMFPFWMSSVCHFGHESGNFGGQGASSTKRPRDVMPVDPPPAWAFGVATLSHG
jgi:hypothetical protein